MTSVPKWQSKFLIKVSIMYKKGSVMKIKDKTTQKKTIIRPFHSDDANLYGKYACDTHKKRHSFIEKVFKLKPMALNKEWATINEKVVER